MKVKEVNNKEELIDFILENYGSEDYTKLITSEYHLEDEMYFEHNKPTLKESMLEMRRYPKSYPCTILINSGMYDSYHSKLPRIMFVEEHLE